jgi:hypothetical protein
MIKNRWYSTLAKKAGEFEQLPLEKIPRVRAPPPIQVDGMGLPRPVLEDSGQGWGASPAMGMGLTPIPFNVTPSMNPSLGLISPMIPGDSPFEGMSPFGRGASMMSPWGEIPKGVFSSPGKVKTSPPSLSENRAELVNLMVRQ